MLERVLGLLGLAIFAAVGAVILSNYFWRFIVS